jgi:NitT/TauT family transport system substrate-binding protein
MAASRPQNWLLAGALLAMGCGRQEGGTDAPPSVASPSLPAGPARVKVAYLGLTCEAAMFVAQEKGFFKEEGLDIDFVKTDWEGLQGGLGLGRFDANYTLIMYLLKPIENGLDVKITGGVHSGCLRVQAAAKSDIKSPKDLKGKRVGVPTSIGSPPFLFTSRVLAANGMDPKKDVEWVVLPPDTLGLAADQGRVDAVCDSEPIGSILLAQGKVRTIADQAEDPPYKDEYCCAVVVSGKLARENPTSAAKATRALLKGARWVEANPTAAARLSVEKKYIAASVEVNAQAISKLKYMPGIARCRKSLDLAAGEMKTAGLLKADTNPSELAARAWLDLEGVNDEWIAGLKVESVAGGGLPAPDEKALASVSIGDVRTCCEHD